MPRAPTPPERFEEWELNAIRREVRDLLGRWKPRWLDEKELEQECALAWWKRRDGYRVERAASAMTFLKIVVRSALKDLQKAEFGEGRRGERLALSLDAPVSEADEGTLGDFLEDAGPSPWQRAEEGDVDAHVERVRRRLSTRQREVFDGLRLDYRVSELSQRLGVSRDTISEDRKRIVAICREEGLEKYLRE